MSDLSTGTYRFLDSLTNSVASSSGSIGASPFYSNSELPPASWDKSGYGAQPGPSPGETLMYSFTNGLATIVDGLSRAAVGGPGVQYDRYGNPITLTYDPRTGAGYTTATAAWPGAPGGPGAYPERVPINYSVGGPWGWLTDLLGLPAPTPDYSVGSVPGTFGAPGSPVIPTSGGTSPLLVLGLLAITAIAAVKLLK